LLQLDWFRELFYSVRLGVLFNCHVMFDRLINISEKW
jgi:hypothetical protein